VSMATVVTRTRRSITLHVHYLPRFSQKSSLLSLEAVNVSVRTCDVECGFLVSTTLCIRNRPVGAQVSELEPEVMDSYQLMTYVW
jgi:hypothetical protein